MVITLKRRRNNCNWIRRIVWGSHDLLRVLGIFMQRLISFECGYRYYSHQPLLHTNFKELLLKEFDGWLNIRCYSIRLMDR